MAGKEYTAKDKIFSMGDTLIRGALKKLIKEHDLPPIVFHSLRHTSVTYKLKLNGGDVKAVQGDSGHAQVSMVTDVYSHIIDEDRKQNVTPIYYYEMCGQMKTLLDRLNPLYSTDYSFRDIYMIATAAENDESAFEKAYNGLQGWVDCFEKASLKGIVCGGGIDDANTAASHVDVMKKAYELGKKL